MSASPFPIQDANAGACDNEENDDEDDALSHARPVASCGRCRSGSDTTAQLAQELEDGLPRRRIRYAASARLEFPRIFGKFLHMEKAPRTDRAWGGPVMFSV